MKLPFSLPFGTKQKKEYFLALLLRDEKVTAVIFEEFLGKVHVIGQSEASFSDSIENAKEEELLEVLDKAISDAESALSNNILTHKTIFGVKENWVEDTKLKKDYGAKIKKASQALELTPIGFLILHEAVIHQMQAEEGAPVSAVLLEIGKKTIAISLVRAGRLVETKRADIQEDSVAKLTDKLLHHFTSFEVLPSRIVIVGDTHNKEELSQAFISHSWSKSLPFLHVPQVTIQPKNYEAKSVLVGAASQMGFELPKGDVSEKSQEKIQKSEEIEEVKETEEEVKHDFGFVKEKDIAVNYSSAKKDFPEETFQEDTSFEENIESHKIDEKNIIQDNFRQPDKETIVNKILNLFKKIISPIAKIFSYLSIPSMNGFSFSKGKTKLFAFFGFIIFLILGFFIYSFFLVKADIIITFDPQIIEKNQEVIFSPTDQTDIEKNVISVLSTSVSEEGSITVPSTGKKEVGENAKGIVTIYSRFTSEKTLPKGTTIKGPNDLEFLFDKAITISSSSADASSEPTKVDIAVTAASIGKESNLPSGTRFTIEGIELSVAVAKNDSAFSGGTKKEVTVVSKDDQTKAISELSKNLMPKASDNLENKISDNEVLLKNLLSTTISKQTFDKKIGDEASSTKLTATITYKGFYFKKSDIINFSKEVLQKDSENKTISEKDITFDIQNIKEQKNQDFSATLNAKASLFPNIDQQKLANDISGKSLTDARNIIEEIEQVSDLQIKIHPNIFFLPQFMPRMAKNINFIVEKN